MPRYFFHISRGKHTFTDSAGVGSVLIWGIMHLTYHDLNTHTGAALTADAGKAGAPGDVTDEMLSAGSEALEKYYLGDGMYDLRSACLRDLFLTMERARPLHEHPTYQTDPHTR